MIDFTKISSIPSNELVGRLMFRESVNGIRNLRDTSWNGFE